VRVGGKIATIGITDYAQRELGEEVDEYPTATAGWRRSTHEREELDALMSSKAYAEYAEAGAD
jgi:glycine cleavage system H lipoate-binding protein